MRTNLSRPDLLEVVTADAVDPAVNAVGEELQELEAELTELRAKAEVLELQVEEARRGGTESGRALTMLERIFAEKAAATREELRAAIEAGRVAADRRVAAARVEAERILRNAQAGTVLPVVPRAAGSRVNASDGSMPTEAAWPARRPAPVESAPAAAARAEPRMSPEETADVEDDESVGEEFFGEREPYEGAAFEPRSQGVLTAESVRSVDPADRFAQFWVASRPEVAHAQRGGVIDVVLPMIAVTLVLVVVLSWIG